MRLIGQLASEPAARTFGDYLFVQGIENRIEQQPGEGWGIWVNEEDKLEKATRLLADFRANPADPKFQAQAKSAAGLRVEREKEEAAWRKKLQDRRQLFRPLTGYGIGPLTLVLILASVVVFILSGYGQNPLRIRDFFITTFRESGQFIEWNPTLPEIRHGEIWRIFTPIFIHFDWMHILFNMLWLRDLGSMIEGRQSSWYLAVLVIVIAAASNLAEFFFGHIVQFGGMSGVVYGLFGFIWLRGKFDPASGLFLHSSTVIMMIVWYFLCLSGILPVANIIHTVGLGIGLAWGYLSSLTHR
jgi:GlpG protein